PKPELKEQPKPELKEQPKPELKEQPKPELKEQPKPELKEQPKPDDPFSGIKDNDISLYADWYDVPPPENDDEANLLAQSIRKWIQNGRPKPGEKNDIEHEELEDEEIESEEKKVKEDKKEKPKKGLFGWRKK
ncbi:MAG TPA: signal recognition particle-docking protein FtsY, partial [Candidatus Nitrosotenuis sp.]|nr:signal recognition particle-docking protein FtsY [Candidatus Nitrosotenuis sp.]